MNTLLVTLAPTKSQISLPPPPSTKAAEGAYTAPVNMPFPMKLMYLQLGQAEEVEVLCETALVIDGGPGR